MPGRDPCEILAKLLATMRALRAPGGCPWDVEQTPESLTPYILEEACEVIEAIETGTPGMIADELGDLLLQVVFQSQIFAERGDFDFADVVAGIDAKLVRRHPHVFSNQDTVMSTGELAAQWERIKGEERTGHPPHPPVQHHCHLPALQRAQKLMSRTMRMKTDPAQDFPQDVTEKQLTEDELGAALLSLVGQAEFNGLNAEQALRRSLQKISNRLDTNQA